MGLLNATPVDADDATQRFRDMLRDDEDVAFAFKTVRDHVLFTDKRMIVTNVQGVTGSKVSYLSIPYRSITSFEVETSGTFELDCDFRISVSGRPQLDLKLSRGSDVRGLQRYLAEQLP